MTPIRLSNCTHRQSGTRQLLKWPCYQGNEDNNFVTDELMKFVIMKKPTMLASDKKTIIPAI